MPSSLEPARLLTFPPPRRRRPHPVKRVVAACAIGALVGGGLVVGPDRDLRQRLLTVIWPPRASVSVLGPMFEVPRAPIERAEELLREMAPLTKEVEDAAARGNVAPPLRRKWLQALGALGVAARSDLPSAVPESVRDRAFNVLSASLRWTDSHGSFTVLERAQLLALTANIATRHGDWPMLAIEARTILKDIDGQRGSEAAQARAIAESVLRVHDRIFPAQEA